MKNRNNRKAFILPTTIFSLVVISVFSILMLTFITSMAVQNRAFKASSNNKLIAEKIFFDFKNEMLDSYENIVVTTYISQEDESIKAIIATKNNSVFCFGIYDFSQKNTICQQNSNFYIEFDENENLVYDNLIFSKFVQDAENENTENENFEQINSGEDNLENTNEILNNNDLENSYQLNHYFGDWEVL